MSETDDLEMEAFSVRKVVFNTAGVVVGLIMFALFVVGTSHFLYWKGYRFQTKNSAAPGIYRFSPLGEIAVGDQVAVCIGGEPAVLARERRYVGAGKDCDSGLATGLKMVGALGGERIDTRPYHRWTEDPQGRAVPRVADFVDVPEGHVFLLSIRNRVDSYDSVVFGPVPTEWLVAKVTKVGK